MNDSPKGGIINFPAWSYDFMVNHLPAYLKRQGLSEIVRVLKPSGRLLIIDFNRPEDGPKTIDGLQDLPTFLKEAGFTDIDSGDLAFKVRSLGGKNAGHQDT